MAEPSSPSGYPLGPAFDDFLQASLGDDGDGMPLSVLTAMSRLNVDPWREAAKLAALPAATAAERLASLLSALPDRPVDGDEHAVARRLVALLPDRAGRPAVGDNPRAGRRTFAFTSPKARLRLALVVAALLGLAYVMTNQPAAPGPEAGPAEQAEPAGQTGPSWR